ncbi:MAG: N-methyl-L-tryptophan oxidase [Chloroflexota bacterium]|nr:N-methyl-L-tryptophan oxidase [Chloroflexota bacterium]
MNYDAIVVGLGAMGSATAHELARRGMRVLGLEAFTPAHQLGSSGGRSRIIRLAYFEHPDYVPMLRAAWDGWHELERRTGERLLLETGGLYAGPRGSAVLEGSLESARRHDLPHELLDGDAVGRRFPALRLDPGMAALHEPLAGLLFPERCIETHLRLARQDGGELHFEERVMRCDGGDGGGAVTVVTDRGEYSGSRLVLAAGAWLPHLVPELELPLVVERNVLFWFEPQASPELLAPDRLPVYIIELDRDHAFYGFPVLPDQGAKVARHHGGRRTDPGQVDRDVHPADEDPVRDFCARYVPAANGRRLDARVCMYTNTPDFNFVIDTHPDDPRVIICSPCSGHGFKFSNVIGRICADLALDGGTEFEIGFLSLRRFAGAAAP